LAIGIAEEQDSTSLTPQSLRPIDDAINLIGLACHFGRLELSIIHLIINSAVSISTHSLFLQPKAGLQKSCTRAAPLPRGNKRMKRGSGVRPAGDPWISPPGLGADFAADLLSSRMPHFLNHIQDF
jgi:hypothetical protein